MITSALAGVATMLSGPVPDSADASAQTLVDVGIPVYRRTTYIREAIESVLAQTESRWRLTVSDDGAGDPAVFAAVEPYLGDERVRYLPTTGQIGAARNWSRIIELATAPYVAILHDDDRWHAQFLRRRVAFLEDHRQCAFAFSGINRIDSDGRRLPAWKPPLRPGVYQPAELGRLLLFQDLIGPTVAVVIRREVFDVVGTFEERLPHCDYEMWVRLALRFSAGYLEEPDADYRVHTESTTHLIRPSGERVRALGAHFVELADQEQPGLLSNRERRQVRAGIFLTALSFDALTPGDRFYATYLFSGAVRAYPPSIVDSRALDWLRILVGPRGRRLLKRLRITYGTRRPSATASGSSLES
jgi:glycosyltransferase involved in cell wall biosynthesis